MAKKNIILHILLILSIGVFLTLSGGCKLTKVQEPEETTPTSTYNPEALHANSGHADETAEAFRHWDEDDPPLVPTRCAKCHSNDGFLDFAADGVVDEAAQPGTLGCGVCHTNSSSGATRNFGSVAFPSGGLIGGLGAEAICMQCHQGRASGPTVSAYLAGRGATVDDTVYPAISFQNIHYFAAAATKYGKFASGGYQYPGQMYDGFFKHVEGYESCQDCHDPHSLQLKRSECSNCHHSLSTASADKTNSGGGFKDIRTKGSLIDYDGDGNVTEGVYYEIEDYKNYLYNAMQVYAKDVAGYPFGYESHTYPYFFYDTNANGVIDSSEANYGNRYRSWTPRLLKAAYNYQVALKDPGGYAHGGKYIIQLLYDSLMDINGANPSPVVTPALMRGDEGHFAGETEAWRHWDEDGEVPGRCAKCHSATGLAEYLDTGENANAHEVANGMLCSTCHTTIPAVRESQHVTFPSGAVLSLPDDSNICLNCHQGRASKMSVDNALAASSGPYYFINVHYFPSAAVFFGKDAKGGYEYPGKTYAGQKLFLNHGGNFDTCIECHMGTKGASNRYGHNLQRPNPADCVLCHGRDVSQPYPGRDPDKFHFWAIRPGSVPDYDGDGNTDESLKSEIQGLEGALYYQIQAYAYSMGKPIIYDSHAYPYFFNDKNGNGLSDPGEAIYPNRYKFTAGLLKAAYNYQVSRKEPNGYIHNSMYIAQLLVDSIGDLGGNVAPYTWR